MAGAISSLGIGSGTLTSDVIDKLKDADNSILVKPVERKIESNTSKTAELSMVTTMLATLKVSTSTLSDDTTYLSRSTSVTGDSVTATANSGVSIQDIDVSVKQLAKQSIFESSNTFSDLDSNVLSSGSNSNFSFFLGSSKLTVNLGDGAVSLSDLVTKINDSAGDKVTASTMNVGGDNPYKLILKSKETGEHNQIYFGESLDAEAVISNDLKAGMSINGVDIVDSDTNYDSINSLIDAINEKVDETNIKAYNNSGTISLKSLDGSEIDIEDSNSGADWTNLGFTVDIGNPEVSAISDGSGSLDAISTFTNLKSGMSINGIDIIDSDTTYNSLDDLIDAINAKKDETNVQAYNNNGQIKLTGIDGNEIDIEDSNSGADWESLGFTVNVGGIEVLADSNDSLDGASMANDLKAGMSINGVDILDSDTNYDSLDDLIDAINAKKDETNVQAYNNNGQIKLKGIDGSAIDIEDTNNGADWGALGFTVDVGNPEVSAIADDDNNDKTRAIIDALGINMLQKSQNAHFTFNGVKIARSTNAVDDLVIGLTLELQKVDSIGDSSTIKIQRDDSGMIDSVREMVASYNQVLNKLTEVTDYNDETGEAGTFQGESTISRIKSSLNRILLTSDFTQDIHNLIDVGIELNEGGLLTFDETKLQSKLSEDSEAVEKLFRGYTASVRGSDVEFDGIFAKMNKELDSLIGDSGSVSLYEGNLKSNKKRLEEERDKAIERIDVRYEIMSNKFAAYDAMISSMNSSFSALQMQIDAMVSSK